MQPKKVKLPYGIGHFPTLIENNYVYVDKTKYIETLENLSPRYFFFLRPRRFGKSLFVSLLSYYYDINEKHNFDKLFSKFYIGKNPTPEANHYWVLNFEFSRIDTRNFETTYQGFFKKVSFGIEEFMQKYNFKQIQIDKILSTTTPNDMLANLFSVCKSIKNASPIYIIIDEYDHFANEVLAFNQGDFSTMVSQNGFVRKFYESIKTGAMEGVVGRFFATGVTPLTLDSMTSGFNITTDLSREKDFNECMGFNFEEVENLVDLVCENQNCNKPKMFKDMKKWYNGYLFNMKAKNRVYNSDMVLYFLNQLSENNSYPESLLDKNIASDYKKVANIFKIGNEKQNLQTLYELVNDREITAELTDKFNFEMKFSRDNLVSLLFYMGFLTFKKPILAGFSFQMPNYVIETLYFDFFIEYLNRQINEDWFDNQLLQKSIVALALNGNPEPIAKELQSALKKLSSRDSIQFAEKNLKVIFVTLLNTSRAYFVKSEYELEKTFVDVLLLERPPIEINYQYAVELKYLPKKEAKNKAKVIKEAVLQLEGYLQNEELQSLENLKAFVLIFVGENFELINVR